LLRCVETDACALGYETVFISLRDSSWRLSDIVSLYKAMVAQVDKEELLRGLCCRVANQLGYPTERYDGSHPLLPLLVEEEGHTRFDAKKVLRRATNDAFKQSDLSLSFRAFAYTVAETRLVGDDEETEKTCWKWFSGEKLEPREKKIGLYDRLMKPTARVWVYSLIRLIRLSGRAGLILLLDDLEALTERDLETSRYRYTPNAAKDTYELIRQLIDDTELLRHFFVLLAGRPAIEEDEKRGFKSYEALWMRLQTGLARSERFNPFADIVDVNKHLEEVGGEDTFASQVAKRLGETLAARGLERHYRETAAQDSGKPLRDLVIETARMYGGD